jgi:hypothetical protein
VRVLLWFASRWNKWRGHGQVLSPISNANQEGDEAVPFGLLLLRRRSIQREPSLAQDSKGLAACCSHNTREKTETWRKLNFSCMVLIGYGVVRGLDAGRSGEMLVERSWRDRGAHFRVRYASVCTACSTSSF